MLLPALQNTLMLPRQRREKGGGGEGEWREDPRHFILAAKTVTVASISRTEARILLYYVTAGRWAVG